MTDYRDGSFAGFQEEKKMEEVDRLDQEKEDIKWERYVVTTTNSDSTGESVKMGDDDDTTKEPKVQAPNKSTSSNTVVHVIGHSMRTLLLDLPLFVILMLYAVTVWFRHVQDNYLIPQLQALPFNDDRGESTYYHRRCDDASEMTTRHGADLFLPVSATPDEAYQHQLKHGFTIFQGILKPETCENLRNFVVSRNYNLKEEESIFVIENKNRYSFGLGTEEPSVTAAMKELANSPRLRPALEKILGPDPALIEMTAITATYGADAQWWHDDVYASASAVQFGRFFGPSYSIFVQLQNTTKAMGATSACPGTHFCGGGAMKEFCDQSGFQLVGDEGHWGQGDALLMNMNSWHRGAAHTDPNAPDRVMLILTFVPKPTTRAETRQLSQGITFSLRWDMWGHTLNDLAKADTAMAQPWATLRSLGLYKKSSASWGIDYVTSASMRTANNDNGFKPGDLEEFLDRGGFWFIPKWLQNFQIDWEEDESWPQYFDVTQKRCEAFLLRVAMYSGAAYFVWFLIVGLIRGKRNGSRGIDSAVVRMVAIAGTVTLLLYLAQKRCDESGWASDIQAGRKYGSSSAVERLYFKRSDHFGPATYPNKKDVLIETRYGSEHLAMYNDFVSVGHPGNAYFRSLVQSVAGVYKDYTFEFQEATARNIAESVATNQGRFLHQGASGYWYWLDAEGSLDYVKQELAIASNAATTSLLQRARYLESDYKYGIYRKSALSIRHAVPYLRDIRRRLVAVNLASPTKTASSYPMTKRSRPTMEAPLQFATVARQRYLESRAPSPVGTAAPSRQFTRRMQQAPSTGSRRTPRQVKLPSVTPVMEAPYLGAWLAEGDLVEAFEDGNWYYGKLITVTAYGDYSMQFSDKSIANFDQYTVRPFSDYHTGERLACWVDAHEDFDPCTIKDALSDGSFIATLDDRDDGKLFRFVKGHFRRPGPQQRTKFVFVDLYHGN